MTKQILVYLKRKFYHLARFYQIFFSRKPPAPPIVQVASQEKRQTPALLSDPDRFGTNAIISGTFGKSGFIDRLIREGKVDASAAITNPPLFNRNYHPKPALNAVLQAAVALPKAESKQLPRSIRY